MRSWVLLTINFSDHRQAVGHHSRPPRRCSLQDRPRRSSLLPCQRRRTSLHYQHLIDLRSSRQCRTSQLRPRKSRCCRTHQDNRQGVGTSIWCPRQHSCVRIHHHTPDTRKGGWCSADSARWNKGRIGNPRKGSCRTRNQGGAPRYSTEETWKPI
jgi:hypothetical protein